MRVGGYVIHLARAVERRAIVDHLTATFPFRCHVLDAVDGRALDDVALMRQVSTAPLFDPPYPFPLGKGEIACFLSHRLAWARIVESGDDFGFVAEDDLGLSSAFRAALDLALRHATVADYVSFQTRPLRGAADTLAEDGAVRLVRPVLPPLRTSAQLVGRDAAARLLAASERFDRPVDCLLQMVWLTGQRMLVVEPSGVSDLTTLIGGSTAQSKRRKSAWEEAVRTVRRMLYRRRIAGLARGKGDA